MIPLNTSQYLLMFKFLRSQGYVVEFSHSLEEQRELRRQLYIECYSESLHQDIGVSAHGTLREHVSTCQHCNFKSLLVCCTFTYGRTEASDILNQNKTMPITSTFTSHIVKLLIHLLPCTHCKPTRSVLSNLFLRKKT